MLLPTKIQMRQMTMNKLSIIDGLKFPELLKSTVTDDSYEDVFHNEESLFTSIKSWETTVYIIEHI